MRVGRPRYRAYGHGMRCVCRDHVLRLGVDYYNLARFCRHGHLLTVGRLHANQLSERAMEQGDSELTNSTSIPNLPLPVSTTLPSPARAPRPACPFVSPFSLPNGDVICRMANLDDRPDHAQHFPSGCIADAYPGSSVSRQLDAGGAFQQTSGTAYPSNPLLPFPAQSRLCPPPLR